ncbi:MAG: PhoPQ-activated protein PqaA family protein [Pirellulaceae bacterium]
MGSIAGEKHLLYVPNAGHGIKDYARVIGSISALHRSRHGGKPLPVLIGSLQRLDRMSRLT